MTVDAHLGSAARHQALHRRAVGSRSTRSATRSTRDLAAARRAPDDGRRADVRLDRRPRRRRVEHRRRMGPTKRRLRRRAAVDRLRDALRAAGPAALRPGQVVSGRAAAALGAELLLAHGRRAGLARPGADRRRGARLRRRRRRRAQRFLHALAERARRSMPQHVFPAYEDACYYLWRERRLPVNVDPFDSQLDDALERARLRGCSTQGLDARRRLRAAARRATAARHALAERAVVPARRALLPDPRRFADGLPAAARLAAVGARRPTIRTCSAPDPTADASAPLAASAAIAQRSCRRRAAQRRGARRAQRARRDPRRRVRRLDHRARRMCVEPRDGVLYVFMPPTDALEDYLELVAAVEATAADARRMPVMHRGLRAAARSAPEALQRHARPGRDRGQHPPGAQLGRAGRAHRRSCTRRRASRASRTEKFMLDGRHTGTGGGNHIVLGGATPADSPFLRRPDLLRSLLALLAQPSVAVVPVLGPVHRPDQPGAARRRGAQRPLYELEIAFQQMPARRRSERCRRGWSTALLRNLLIDVTGNTHRAEFCIDKLYSPDGPTGRLGPARAARLRDAAARAHEPGAAAAAARAGRALLAARRTTGAPRALGHRAARPLHAAALRAAGLRAT